MTRPSSDHVTRPARVARGIAVGSVATFAAALAHVTAGGAVPAVLGVMVPWMLAIAACTTLAGRRWSFVRVTLGVTVAQSLFHVLFTLGSLGTSSSDGGGHIHGDLSALPNITTTSGTPQVSMMLAHFAVVAVTVLLVALGDHILQRARAAGDRAVALTA